MIRSHQDNCLWCAHYLGERRCEAFPESIPDPLWTGDNPHREPFEGDRGIRYQSRPMEIPDAETFLKWGGMEP